MAEVHHRVKNNMQVITSLLNLQTEDVSDAYTRALLEESRNRIHSMALVHEQLYRSKEYACISFEEYVHQLGSTLFSMYQVDFDVVQLVVEADNINLDLEKAIPCGLILNELITNSLKYAFPDGKNGEIRVSSQTEKGKIKLSVSDNGIGLQGNLNFHRTKSLGLQLVHLLVEHDLHGDIVLEKKSGTKYCIEFPVSSERGKTLA